MSVSCSIVRSVSSDSIKQLYHSHFCDDVSSSIVQPSNDHEDMDQLEKPRRPLSAYNFFFRYERSRILRKVENGTLMIHKNDDGTIHLKYTEDDLGHPNKLCVKDVQRQLDMIDTSELITKRPHRKSHGKFSFTELSRYIGKAWASLGHESRQVFEVLATEEKDNYKEKVRQYKVTKQNIARKLRKKQKMHKAKIMKKKYQRGKNILKSKTLPVTIDTPELRTTMTPIVVTSQNAAMPRRISSDSVSLEDIKEDFDDSFTEDERTHFSFSSCQNALFTALIGDHFGHAKKRPLIDKEEQDLAEFLLDFDWQRF